MTKTKTQKPGGTAAQFLTWLHNEQCDLWSEALENYDGPTAAALIARRDAAFAGGYLTHSDEGVYKMTAKGQHYVDGVHHSDLACATCGKTTYWCPGH